MNRVAIVTGGTRGIGFAIAKALLEDGNKVIINFRSHKEQANKALQALRAISEDVIMIQADISLPDDRQTLVKQTLKQLNKIDILINNAGLAGKKSFLKETEEEFNQVLATNL